MEEKTIKMKGPHPVRRLLKKHTFWLFTIGALVVAVAQTIDGNVICGIWAILAAGFNALAEIAREYADDFMELNGYLIKELDTMQEVLREKDNKIAELQTENISLRFGKTTKQ